MREILFRGKRIDNGEWVFGSIAHQADYYGDRRDRWFIVEDSFTSDYGIDEVIEVKKETVGQYTGLTDRNGKQIFEGDVVEYIHENLAVAYDDGTFQFVREDTFYDLLNCGTSGLTIIVGNIYDNPELLEAVTDNG